MTADGQALDSGDLGLELLLTALRVAEGDHREVDGPSPPAGRPAVADHQSLYADAFAWEAALVRALADADPDHDEPYQ